MTEDNPTRKIAAPVSWRDLFVLEIADANLKRRAEGFLDFYQSTAFKYAEIDPVSGAIVEHEFSGQEVMARCLALRRLIEDSGEMAFFTRNNLLKSGKFTIAQHDRPYGNNHFNGSNTVFAGSGHHRIVPVKIELGRDYLKGAKYFDTEGKLHPVTVDAIIAHELGHFSTPTHEEVVPMQTESIVIAAMGGAQRGADYRIAYTPNGNGGYQSLHHRVVQSTLAQTFETCASTAMQARLPAVGFQFIKNAVSLRGGPA